MFGRDFGLDRREPRSTDQYPRDARAAEIEARLDAAMLQLRLARSEIGETARGAERLARLEQSLSEVQHLIAASEAADSTFPPRDERQNLADALRRLVASFRELAEDSSVSVRIECERDAGSLPAGPLEALLASALRSAIESCTAAPAHHGSSVTIAVRRRGARLFIDVVDNGSSGIDAPSAAHPGRREPSLAVAHRVAERLGGTIELTAIPFGQGAVFRAEIPVARLTMREAA